MESGYKRYGKVIKIKPQYEEEYKKYHAEIWPAVAESLKRSGITKYSIFLKDGYLFAYIEEKEDGNKHNIPQNKEEIEECEKWGEIMSEMQEPVEGIKPGEWWAEMEEVFHLE